MLVACPRHLLGDFLTGHPDPRRCSSRAHARCAPVVTPCQPGASPPSMQQRTAGTRHSAPRETAPRPPSLLLRRRPERPGAAASDSPALRFPTPIETRRSTARRHSNPSRLAAQSLPDPPNRPDFPDRASVSCVASSCGQRARLGRPLMDASVAAEEARGVELCHGRSCPVTRRSRVPPKSAP